MDKTVSKTKIYETVEYQSYNNGGISNLEKLVRFAEEIDEDGDLIPLFLSLLEMCADSKQHRL